MVAINVALGYGADTQATTGLIKIRPVTRHPVIKDGQTFLALADWQEYALDSEPIVWNLIAGQLYERDEVVPRGSKRVFECPDETTNYADLVWLDPIPGTGGAYVVQQVTWVVDSDEDLPDEAIPGQTYYEPDTDNFGTVGA
jgi:hypothetical protein